MKILKIENKINQHTYEIVVVDELVGDNVVLICGLILGHALHIGRLSDHAAFAVVAAARHELESVHVLVVVAVVVLVLANACHLWQRGVLVFIGGGDHHIAHMHVVGALTSRNQHVIVRHEAHVQHGLLALVRRLAISDHTH